VGRGFVWVIVGIFQTLCFFLTLSYDEATFMIALSVCLWIPIIVFSEFWIAYVLSKTEVYIMKRQTSYCCHMMVSAGDRKRQGSLKVTRAETELRVFFGYRSLIKCLEGDVGSRLEPTIYADRTNRKK